MKEKGKDTSDNKLKKHLLHLPNIEAYPITEPTDQTCHTALRGICNNGTVTATERLVNLKPMIIIDHRPAQLKSHTCSLHTASKGE